MFESKAPDVKQIKTIKPFNAIIFGGDGDLALRKIYPAFFHRFIDKQLNVDYNIYAVTRQSKNDSAFYETLKKFIEESIEYKVDKPLIDKFIEMSN